MPHLSGPKYGKHTTVVKPASLICKHLEPLDEVTKMSLGFINQIRRSNSEIYIKIIDEAGCILLKLLEGRSSQEIRIYSKNCQKTRKIIEKFVKKNKWKLKPNSRVNTPE